MCRTSLKCNQDKVVLTYVKNFNLKLFSELYNDQCDGIEIINSTFAMHIAFVMTSLMLTDVFAAYGILRGCLSSSGYILQFLLFSNTFWVAMQYGIKALIAHAGTSTTAEAEKSLVLVTRLVEATNSDKELTTDLNFLLIQMQCRNKNLQNHFFTINWSLILAVSFILRIFSIIEIIWFQITSMIVTYLIITFQFDTSAQPHIKDVS